MRWLVGMGGLVQIEFAGQQIDFGACSHSRRDRQHARLGRLLEHHFVGGVTVCLGLELDPCDLEFDLRAAHRCV